VSDEDGPDELAPFRQTLADLLAALRREAGLTQQQVADRLGYSRATVAGAETGHRQPGEAFWARCDDLQASRGELRAAHAQLAGARRDRAERLVRQAETERDARVARWRAANLLPVAPADVTTTTSMGDAAQGDLLESVLRPSEVDEPCPVRRALRRRPRDRRRTAR
jgi:transcriptional regulator with XRE-family HTH domain